MTDEGDLKRLSDLIALCAATMRMIVEARNLDGQASDTVEIACDLEMIAHRLRGVAAELDPARDRPI